MNRKAVQNQYTQISNLKFFVWDQKPDKAIHFCKSPVSGCTNVVAIPIKLLPNYMYVLCLIYRKL